MPLLGEPGVERRTLVALQLRPLTSSVARRTLLPGCAKRSPSGNVNNIASRESPLSGTAWIPAFSDSAVASTAPMTMLSSARPLAAASAPVPDVWAPSLLPVM